MFWNRNRIDNKMIGSLRPTSKAALKQQCLLISKGDLEQASKLYEFMIKDMEELPMFDLEKPTTFQQIKDGASQTFSWINENQETIMNWAGFIREMFGKGGNSNMPIASSNPISPINQ